MEILMNIDRDLVSKKGKKLSNDSSIEEGHKVGDLKTRT
jgi:hypothetical protein